ncbi:MAG: hypothetical protein AAFW46_01855 [Pseudomonadota bacterium]
MAETMSNPMMSAPRRAAAPTLSASDRGARRRRKAAEFRLYFLAAYPLFLLVALASRLLPRSRRPFSAGERSSVFADAKAAAYTVLPFVFMG